MKSREMRAEKTLDEVMPPDATQDVEAVLKTLNDGGVRFLIGGMAAINAYFGIIRASKDIDVFITSDRTVGGLRYTLNRHGFKTGKKRTALFLAVLPTAPGRGEPIMDIITQDTFLTPIPKDSEENAIPLKLGALELKGMPVEDILLLKKKRGSPTDEEDIADALHELRKRGIELDPALLLAHAKEWHCQAEAREMLQEHRKQ